MLNTMTLRHKCQLREVDNETLLSIERDLGLQDAHTEH